MAGPGPVACYAVDVVGIAVATLLYARLGHHAPSPGSAPPSVAGIAEGLRYAVRRRDLLGTYLVDIAAMITAMPETLFPSLPRPCSTGPTCSASCTRPGRRAA